MQPVEIRFNPTESVEITMLIQALMFELKDRYTLQNLENIMHSIVPGDYKVVKWATMDADLDVIIQFSCMEEFVLFQMYI